jgi:colanic acid/amylovoran biosynthesis glycosyltransferase
MRRSPLGTAPSEVLGSVARGEPAVPARATRVAYIIARFPTVRETFIRRELDAVASHGLDVTVLALFPTPPGPVQDAARPWLARVRRARPWDVATALAWWLRRRPGRTLSSLALVARGHARSPARLRALVTFGVAASHARWVAQHEVDRLHAHWATYGALSAWVIRRLTGTPYSFTAHAHDLYIDQAFLREKVADAEVVVTISEYNRRFLRRYGGDVTTPVTIVRYGIEPSAYPFRPRTPAADRPVRVLCVAALQEYKGHRVLLDALGLHGEGLERLAVTCVGDGPLRGDLEGRARALGLEGRVTFRGAMTESQILGELASTDLFVLPSIVARSGQMEGLPVALIEAMACGVPVVSTALSGTPELVRPGVTGVLVPPGDARALAAALRSVLDDPEAAAQRSLEGRALVEREFGLERLGSQMAAILAGRPGDGGVASPSRG